MKSFMTEGIVLKRSNVGEADRIVTLFTREFGKMACVAKGVRKIVSSKKSALEPGVYSKIFCVEAHGMPILTQAQIIEDYPHMRTTLPLTRSLAQVLEIFDTVIVEEQGQEELFDQAIEVLRELNSEHATRSGVTEMLEGMLSLLGFEKPENTQFKNISEYVEYISERKMRSFKFLTVAR
jgi:DNA repair protein RecO (recombination protein O)